MTHGMQHSDWLSPALAEHLRRQVLETPDFPQPGVLFRDLSKILCNATDFDRVITALCGGIDIKDIDLIAGIESRGYIYGAAVAAHLNLGFVPIRKPGKIPNGQYDEVAYKLEYGIGRLQLQKGLIQPSDRVVIIDDLLATGGSAFAAAELAYGAGGNVQSFAFVLELTSPGGRAALERLVPKADVHALLTYP